MRKYTALAVTSLVLLVGAAFAQEQPLGYVMLYNAGPTAREGVALGAAVDLGFAVPATGVVVRDGEKELPAQVSGDTLGVWVALRGYEH